MGLGPNSGIIADPTLEQYKAVLSELTDIQRRYNALLEIERNRTLDYKEGLARLEQARMHMDEVREYYSAQIAKSHWSTFWSCVVFFALGATLTLLALFAFTARPAGFVP